MEALLLIVMGIVMGAGNIACFLIGARVGQQTAKGEKVELPAVNPMQAYREKEARKEAQKEQDKFDTIMWNVDNYDGTGRGQKEVK